MALAMQAVKKKKQKKKTKQEAWKTSRNTAVQHQTKGRIKWTKLIEMQQSQLKMQKMQSGHDSLFSSLFVVNVYRLSLNNHMNQTFDQSALVTTVLIVPSWLTNVRAKIKTS